MNEMALSNYAEPNTPAEYLRWSAMHRTPQEELLSTWEREGFIDESTRAHLMQQAAMKQADIGKATPTSTASFPLSIMAGSIVGSPLGDPVYLIREKVPRKPRRTLWACIKQFITAIDDAIEPYRL